MNLYRPIAVLLAMLTVAGAVPGCSRRASRIDEGRRTGTLHLAISAEPRELDPQLQVDFEDMMVSLALFEGLTAIDERSSEPVPAAAERWEISADRLTWIFHLRPGLQWSDGVPLTADDFVYSLRRALSPSLASKYAYVLYPIIKAEDFNGGRVADPTRLGVRARDRTTLEIALERPTPFLAAILALPVAFPVPRQAIEKPGASADADRRWTRPGDFVGNGPFTLREWTPNQRIVVGRNPRFREPVRLQAMVFYPYENAAAQEAAFRSGLLHLTSDVPAARLAAYREHRSPWLRTDPYLETSFLRFNTTRAPLDDERVRRALALAIDRQTLVDRVALGGPLPATALTPPGTAGYTANAAVTHDIAAAQQLLAAAGFPAGRGFPVVDAMFFSGELNQKVLEAIQQMWERDLGVKVTLSGKEKQVWLDDERRLNYQISSARWGGDYVDPSTFLELFLSQGGNNATGWSNPEYDRLVRRAGGEEDPGKRRELYQTAEAILLREMPIAPLFHGARSYLIHPTVHGWEPALLGFHRYQHVWLE